MNEARRAFTRALCAWRKSHGLSQAKAGELLGLTRKSYGAMENEYWDFGERERTHVVQMLFHHDEGVARAYAAWHGVAIHEPSTPTTMPVAAAPPAPSVALDPVYARAVVDAALYTVAETFEVAPKAVRKIAAALLARFATVELTMPQAAAVVAAADAEMEARSTPRA